MDTNGTSTPTDDVAPEVNPADALFDSFLYEDNTVLKTLEQFAELKNLLDLNHVPHHQLFSKLKGNFTSWKLTSFLEIIQRRLNVKDYVSSVDKCRDCNIFIVGAGPCGLRCAIEAALCGSYVVVVEKRTSFTRNNVLHLWPYLIHDLRNLGIKKLFGKFCAGSLDHISIRRLQLILMKISLVLGVKVYVGTSYVDYLEPCASTGWRMTVKPSNKEIEMIDFDVLVGADGRRNCIPGFQRKEFRAKLAIGITANFVNKNSDEEAKIEEISGVAALFNQKFFADLKSETDIDLENIVYYKDDTHYFVMTAKKQCLLKKGVLKEDNSDVLKLLAFQNVDNKQLLNFVAEAAEFSTNLPHSQFAVNPDSGKPDVAIFDFTSMYSAEYAAKIIERRGRRLIVGLVGDGLMEPFWPLGTGCARGFLSCMDLMWMIKQHQQGTDPKDLLAERMALYNILHQTTNENMNKKHSAYTMNPKTRYKLIPKFTEDVNYLYENDEKENKRARTDNYSPEKTSPNKRLAGETTETVHKQWKKSTFARTRKPKNPSNEGPLQKKRSLSPTKSGDQEALRKWCADRLKLILPFLPVTDLDSCWRDGVLLCGLVHLCTPKEIDMNVVKNNTDAQNVDLAISVMFNEFGIQTLTAQDVLPPSGPDLLAIMSTILELQKVYQEIEKGHRRAKPLRPKAAVITPPPAVDHVIIDNKPAKKTKINEPVVAKATETTAIITAEKTVPEPVPMEVDKPSPGAFKKRVHSQRKLRKKTESKFIAQVDNVEMLPNTPVKVATPSKGSQKCHTCALNVLVLKRVTVEGYVFHRKCFVCEECQTTLKTSTYHLITSPDPNIPGRFFCKKHFNEIMSRSRELKKSQVAEKKKPPVALRTKDKKKSRPASASFESMKVTSRPFRPSTPVLKEDEVVEPTNPFIEPEPQPEPTVPKEPEAKKKLPSVQSRYRDTALVIHEKQATKKQLPESPTTKKRQIDKPDQRARDSPAAKKRQAGYPAQRAVSPDTNKPRIAAAAATRVASPNKPVSPDPKSPKLTSRVKVLETGSPEIARVRTESAREKRKVISYHEDLPVEGMPDNSLLNSGTKANSSPPIDLIPSEGIPSHGPISNNVTVRKKSKKAHRAPAPPARTRSDLSTSSKNTTTRERSNTTAAAINTVEKIPYGKKDKPKPTEPMISRSAAKLSPEPNSVADNATQPPNDIASGVKGRIVKDTADNTAAPQKPKAVTRHARAGSATNIDNYIPNITKQLQEDISNKVDEGGPVSVRDRIALYAQRDNATSASFSAGQRKRIEVSSDLKKSVTRDGSRITSARGAVETDFGTGQFSRGTYERRKRLRLKPANKMNQRRLAQAQTIQRDRSLLEQKMTEFENEAADIETLLREGGNDDKGLLSQFLELVNMKNEMTRRENELHLCEKYLQLLDEQDQIERDLRYLLGLNSSQKTEQDSLEEEELILKKFDVVNRRDYLLTQLDENKRREEEENKQIEEMLEAKGMSSKHYSYNTDSFLTIESLLEPDEDKEDEVEESLAIYEQTTAQVKRKKKGRKDNDENALSRFFNRMSIFN